MAFRSWRKKSSIKKSELSKMFEPISNPSKFGLYPILINIDDSLTSEFLMNRKVIDQYFFGILLELLEMKSFPKYISFFKRRHSKTLSFHRITIDSHPIGTSLSHSILYGAWLEPPIDKVLGSSKMV